jgi:hypothetical protein
LNVPDEPTGGHANPEDPQDDSDKESDGSENSECKVQ